MNPNGPFTDWDQDRKYVLSKLEDIETDLKELKKDIKEIQDRLLAIETHAITAEALDRYKKWVLGAGFTIITAVLLPILRIILGGN